MDINLIWDSSVASAPAAFKTAVAAAANFLDNLIINPITVNIGVGWGEDDNGAYPINPADEISLGGALAWQTMNYSSLKSALAANVTTTADQYAVAGLPANDPTGGKTFFVSDAEASALGLLPASSTVIEGAVGFSDTAAWNYSTSGQAVPGEIDFVSDAELELIHALGMELGTPSGSSTAFTLFHYSASGVRELTVNSDGVTTPAAYFSIDGGKTNLGNYLTSGDSTLFAAEGAIAENDTLAAPYPYGQERMFSAIDALELNVLGFNVNATYAAAVNAVSNAALAVEASMYGVVGSSAEISKLDAQFLPAQVAFALSQGFNPQVFATQALGLAFAFGSETGSTTFANDFGPANAATPNSAAGDAAFAAAAAAAVFGSAETANTANAIGTWVNNWKAFYTANGLPGMPSATAAQIDLAARGAAWGEAVGTALANNLGPLPGQVTNFLEDAAQGSAVYSASLGSQPMHAPFSDASVGITGVAVHHLV